MCFVISPITVIIILACIGDAPDYDREIKKERDRNQQLERRISDLEKQAVDKKPCPLCGENIEKKQKYCQFCGGNVEEKEKEDRARKQEEFEGKGYDYLLKDEKIASGANLVRRMYGEKAYHSYLKDKAEELGLGKGERVGNE